jgi:hypothetical protein
MLDILIGDCINNIKYSLSYIDLLCYKLTNKSNHNKMILPDFTDVFIKRLLQHNIVPSLEDAKLLCDNLYNTGAYIAGSFILDCLYDTNYHGDIDIYDQTGLDLIPKNKSEMLNHEECCQEEKDRKYEYTSGDTFKDFESKNLQFMQSLYKLGFRGVHHTSSPDPIIRKFLYKTNPIIEEKIYKDYPSDFSIKEKETSNDCIQIIPINMNLKPNERSVIPRFIKSTFDLDICQNIFDGEKLQIKNVNKLIYKYDYIKPNTRFMLTVYEQQEKDEEEATKKRRDKYLARGFNIDFHPEYDKINTFIIDMLKLKKYNFMGHQNCIISDYEHKYDRYQNNIKYVDNGEIDLSIFDIN